MKRSVVIVVEHVISMSVEDMAAPHQACNLALLLVILLLANLMPL